MMDGTEAGYGRLRFALALRAWLAGLDGSVVRALASSSPEWVAEEVLLALEERAGEGSGGGS